MSQWRPAGRGGGRGGRGQHRASHPPPPRPVYPPYPPVPRHPNPQWRLGAIPRTPPFRPPTPRPQRYRFPARDIREPRDPEDIKTVIVTVTVTVT